MSLDRKILEELKRFNQINTYILNEQPEPPAPPALRIRGRLRVPLGVLLMQGTMIWAAV